MPIPERGYWNKLHAGKKINIAEVTDAAAGGAISASGGDARKTLNRLIAANEVLRN